MKNAILILMVLMFGLQTVSASEETRAPTLSDLTWLSGEWLSEKDGVIFETIWSPLRGDALVGTTRVIKENKTAFYEILTMSQSSSGIHYRFDYYDSKNQFQNPKATVFDLNSLTGRRAVFDHTESADQLILELDEKGRLTGTWVDHTTDPATLYLSYQLTRVER